MKSFSELTGKQNLALIVRQVDVLRVRRLAIVRQVDQYIVTFGKNYNHVRKIFKAEKDLSTDGGLMGRGRRCENRK